MTTQEQKINSLLTFEDGVHEGMMLSDKKWRKAVQKRIDCYTESLIGCTPATETWKRRVAIKEELTKLLEK